ncbi:MAG: acyltransferase family protein [Eubacteriales bacterium]|nr:acyltransferase family protein [Eubacteriales bacterium]
MGRQKPVRSQYSRHPGHRKPCRHSGSDGLRVLAMLGVAAFHISPETVPAGFLGVVIFLVLAGYYTTRSFTVNPRPNYAAYYGKKIRKLWPPLLFMLVLVGLVAAIWLPEVEGFFRSSAPSAVLGWHNLAEIWKDRSYFARHGSYDPLVHLWAMSLEMQYYLVYPLLYWCLSRLVDNLPRKHRPYGRELSAALLGILGFISALYMGLSYNPAADPTPYYYNSFMRANAFLSGASLCLWASGKEMREAYYMASGQPAARHATLSLSLPLRTLLAWLCLLLSVAAFFIFEANSAFLYRGGFYLYGLLIAAFIWLSGVKPVPGMGFMESKVFRYLASRSYYIYLWQYAIMVLVETALRFSTLSFWPRLLIQLTFVLALSEISYRLFSTKTLSEKAQALLSAVLVLSLFTMLIIPARKEPAAPKLDNEAIRQALEENASIQASLAAAQSEEDASSDASRAAAQREEDASSQASLAAAETAETTAQKAAGSDATETSVLESGLPGDLLLKGSQYISDNNPFGYSPGACRTLDRLNLVIIGDSVLAMAMKGIRTYIPRVYIDAAAARKFANGLPLLESFEADGRKADILVISLANNGHLDEADLEQYIKLAGDRPLIFVNLVVAASWEQPNNNKFAAAAEKYSNVYVADWYSAAKHVPGYFYLDGTHPVPEGAAVYDQVVLDTILQVISEDKYTLHPARRFPMSPPPVMPILDKPAEE